MIHVATPSFPVLTIKPWCRKISKCTTQTFSNTLYDIANAGDKSNASKAEANKISILNSPLGILNVGGSSSNRNKAQANICQCVLPRAVPAAKQAF